MTPEEFLKAGQPAEALAALQEAVRKAPADPKLRRFLFQLLIVLGRWEKAVTQLEVIADMDVESKLMAEIFRPVIGCEILRSEVFKGARTPLIFGEPQAWVGQLLQAHQLAAQGHFKAARDLQDQALEAAPARSGQINGTAFEWIADADSRLGPMAEAYMEGKYYWVPWDRVAKVEIAKPEDLRDLVWITATFTWTNGGQTPAYMPVRYPGSDTVTDGGLQMSRKTEWVEQPEGFFFGSGQRTLTTDAGDYPLLETRTIEFTPDESASASAEIPAAPEAPDTPVAT